MTSGGDAEPPLDRDAADRALFAGNPYRSPLSTHRATVATCTLGACLFAFCIATQIYARVDPPTAAPTLAPSAVPRHLLVSQ